MADTDVLRRASAFRYDGSNDKIVQRNSADLDMDGNRILNCQTVNDLAMNGPGYHFDGIDDNIIVDHSNDLKLSEMSIIANVNIEDISTQQTIVAKPIHSLWRENYSLGIISNTLRMTINDGAGQSVSAATGSVLSQGNCNVGSVYDGSVISLYYNDSEYKTTVGAYDLQMSNDELILGGDWYGGYSRYFKGYIGRALIFNLALSTDEMQEILNGAAVPYKYLGASQTEKITNNTFDAAIGPWGSAGGWAWETDGAGGGRARHSTGSVSSMSVLSTLTEGKAHIIDYTIGGLTTGTVTPRIGNTLGVARTANGIYSETIIGGDTQYISIIPDTNFDGYIDDIYVKQIGCVAQYEQPEIGHNQWLEISGNELHGAVSGVLPTNLPFSHDEKYIETVTGDSSFVLPAGYMITAIVFDSDGAIGGGIDVGLTNGGGEIVTAEAISGAGAVLATLVAGANYNLTGADDTIYITDADGTGWDSATVGVTVQMKRIT